MTIRIEKCSIPGAWYGSRIGETIHVERVEVLRHSSQGIPEDAYWCRTGDAYNTLNYVPKSDATEVRMTDEKARQLFEDVRKLHTPDRQTLASELAPCEPQAPSARCSVAVGSEIPVCPTCKSQRWAEIYPSKTDPTGLTLYCRRCEEGCVSPLILPNSGHQPTPSAPARNR
jgi:hypothetical protein